MSETTNKLETFVTDFLKAMEEQNLAKAKELTDTLPEEEKKEALAAVVEGINKKDDAFKESNKEVIDALLAAKAQLDAIGKESSAEPDTGDSEAPSEEAAPVEEAPAENKE